MLHALGKFCGTLFKFILKTVIICVAGILMLLFFHAGKLPDLDVWHTRILESEFSREDGLQTFEAYLELEDRLFEELDEKISTKIPEHTRTRLNRFVNGSLSDPALNGPNWNRSFVLNSSAPKACILLLHGMSDSPYSLRHLGNQLNKKGAFVVGLRLPGHGTAPSGLLKVQWEDLAVATELAMNYTSGKNKDCPVYIIGYSTGAALGLHYALRTLNDAQLKKISGIVMISPAIGVGKIAALAQTLEKTSRLPGFHKLAWTDIIPEYNPYKYNSFTTNAGDQVYRLTRELNRLLAEAQKENRLDALPPISAFQSITDATVSTAALVKNLFNKLPPKGDELLIFDINRTFDFAPLIRKDPVPAVHDLFKTPKLAFNVSFITNKNHKAREMMLRQRKAGDDRTIQSELSLAWPVGIYSLSHVALPFPADDPVYGIVPPDKRIRINLGNIPLKGEKGILTIPAAEFNRLKYNPFYPYMEEKIMEFIF